MARLNPVPLIVLATIGALAVVGGKSGTFDTPSFVTCAYQLASLDAPPADVLFIGSSRMGQGIDPGYMVTRIAKQTGQNISIERLALNFPNIPQFRPVISRYIDQRGAPKHVFLQLIYNFKPFRQRSWDIPVNTIRNVAHAELGELIEIRADAELNDYHTRLPREMEAGYLSLPALVLQKLEINVFAALRYPAQHLLGNGDVCKGDALFSQSRPEWPFNRLTDDIEFGETEAQKDRRMQYERVASNFMQLSPNSSFRHFETDQLHDVIEMLEAAGSNVWLTTLPFLGDTTMTQQEADSIAAAFPDHLLIHPYSLFETDVGPDLAKSFVDTHHATPFGALQYSRYFADVIAGMAF